MIEGLVRLDKQLSTMQSAGKVDSSVDDTLEKLVASSNCEEEYWFNSPPTPANFAIYHAWRNLRLIFSRMRTRFAEAPFVKDNPLVVDQARTIMPRILNAIPMIVALEEDPTQGNSDYLMTHLRQMRRSARSTKMIDEELKGIDTRKLIQAFDELLKPMTSAAAN